MSRFQAPYKALCAKNFKEMYQKEHREYLLEIFSYYSAGLSLFQIVYFFEVITIAVNRAYDMDGEKHGINKKDVTQLFIISTRWNMWNELHHPGV